MNKLKTNSGFTMIEVLIVTALTIATAVAGFTGFSTFRKSQTLKLGVQELAATLSAARQQSIAQENGTGWGVRLTSGSSTDAHTYKIFSGSSFAAGTTTQSYVLGRGAKFSNPRASSTMDVIFAGATGFPSSSQVITLINGFTDGQIGDVIVKSLGSIATRLDNGLVGYWHLDEGTGAATYDASGYGNNGTLNNSPTWAFGSSCKFGNCLYFDNSAQKYVSVADSASTDARTNLTLSAWVYPIGAGGTDSYSTILQSSGSGYYLSFYDATSALSCYWYGKTPAGYHTTSASTVPLNQWTHVVCVWDSANVYQYINGVLSKTTATTGAGTGATSINIGAENLARKFQGYIDEVKVYTRSLSASEILAAYNDLK
jgi:Tfp pilus assembly protein FimT